MGRKALVNFNGDVFQSQLLRNALFVVIGRLRRAGYNCKHYGVDIRSD